MAQYIDKDALVAEIKRLRDTAFELYGCSQFGSAYNNVLKSIDTLEVKEVDLEKYYHDFLQKEWFGNNCVRTMSEMMAFTAKHFFELGISVRNKAQKGENNYHGQRVFKKRYIY